MTPDELRRFLAKVDRDAPGGCWTWTRSRFVDGRGRFYFRGQVVSAARVAFEHWVRLLKPGEEVGVTCGNRGCVNPAHLLAASHQTHLLRSERTVPHCNATATVCKHGHPLTPENVYEHNGRPGWRGCLTCRRELDRQRRQRETSVAPP